MVGASFDFRPYFQKKHPLKIRQGQLLAVAFSDSSVSLISAQTGKAAHHVQYSRYSNSRVSSLAWSLNFTDAKSTRGRLEGLGSRVTLEDIFNRGSQTQYAEKPLDLPTDLAFLDAESILPKLSVLPAGGKEFVSLVVYSQWQCVELIII